MNLPKIAAYASATSAALLALVCLAPAASADDRPHHGPPPEAIAACEKLAEGDACKVTFGPNTLDGTCAKTPDGVLACRPEHMPPPPDPPK
jgi:hypothetical protein